MDQVGGTVMGRVSWRGFEDDEAVGDPSALLEEAVVAYTRGRFAIAIHHLRRLEQAAVAGQTVVDARHAALRGALAARARNWVECYDWYERSLAFTLPAGVARQESLFCLHEGCLRSGRRLCGQCDRWFCRTHSAEVHLDLARCDSCLDTALHNLTQASILADRTETAVEVLAPWARTAGWGTAKALLACLAPEEAAESGEPADVLDSLAPDRRAALLLYRASRTFDPADLEGVCAVEPGGPDVPPLVAKEWLRARNACRLSREGLGVEAWAVRYEDWLTRPADVDAVHALALAALRVFSGDAGADDRTRRAAARQAIACWATVLHSAAYWRELERCFGRSLAADERTAASDALAERIRQALRDDDRAADREPADSLELAWDLELAVARGLPDVLDDRLMCLDGGYRFSFGPGFLDLLASAGSRWDALAEEVRDQVSAASGWGDSDAERLDGLLSSEGRHLMLLESGKFDDVIASLEADGGMGAAPEATGDASWHVLVRKRVLGTALLGRARAHVAAKRWSAAVRDFEDAAAAGVGVTADAEKIGRAGVHAGFALFRNRSDTDWNAYVGLLERALVMAPDHEELRRNLSAGCVRLGEQALRQERRDEARVRFARAHELDPANKAAVTALNKAEIDHAERLVEGGSASGGAEAVVLLRRVLGRGDAEDTDLSRARRVLVPVLYQQSLDAALDGDDVEATGLMREVRALTRVPDEELQGFGGEDSPEYDIAEGLLARVSPPWDMGEEELRSALAVLAVTRAYAVPPGLSDRETEVLSELAELLCNRERYDEVVGLARRCPSDAGDRRRLDMALAKALTRRTPRGPARPARANKRFGHQAGDGEAPVHQLPLFGTPVDDQLW
ncbi:hypothetical protein [Streptomyces sp. MJP52]|uniref:hypothetical protein n=1 Tax=Streptomyces sp. MJP52 TaxID=2940555 RepID=UPI0024762CF8|nr:hypothetical protein [Streptomyces sp. MJP52]MDH6223282.1 hypothetical protein [Streptomyces sp. MJP52]